MKKVIAARLHQRGKLKYLDVQDFVTGPNTTCVVETEQGLEMAFCSGYPAEVEDDFLEGKTLLPVIRLTTVEDELQYAENLRLEEEALAICEERVSAHELPMKLVLAEYVLDRRRLIFYFTADGRVDFRNLVKDLAAIFRTRIELRQIGVRDEACLMGGLGICGRQLCCASFMQDFHPVSIKMAKEQNLSMNPAKISGCCSRLLCCLKHEEEAYEDAHRRLPSKGCEVETEQGRGVIESVNLLKETVSVRLNKEDADNLILPVAQVRVLKRRKPAKAEKTEQTEDSEY